MVENSEKIETSNSTARRKISWQFGILSVLLLTTLIATWVAWNRAKTEAAYYSAEIPAMRAAARELNIEDPSMYAVACQDPDWYGDDKWLVYLPDGHRYSLNGEFTVFVGEEMVTKTMDVEIEPGEHSISVREAAISSDQSKLEVLLDGGEAFSLVSEKINQCSSGSSGGGKEIYQEILDSLLVLKNTEWMSIGDPAKFKKAFDQRDQEQTYYRHRIYIRTND